MRHSKFNQYGWHYSTAKPHQNMPLLAKHIDKGFEERASCIQVMYKHIIYMAEMVQIIIHVNE